MYSDRVSFICRKRSQIWSGEKSGPDMNMFIALSGPQYRINMILISHGWLLCATSVRMLPQQRRHAVWTHIRRTSGFSSKNEKGCSSILPFDVANRVVPRYAESKGKCADGHYFVDHQDATSAPPLGPCPRRFRVCQIARRTWLHRFSVHKPCRIATIPLCLSLPPEQMHTIHHVTHWRGCFLVEIRLKRRERHHVHFDAPLHRTLERKPSENIYSWGMSTRSGVWLSDCFLIQHLPRSLYRTQRHRCEVLWQGMLCGHLDWIVRHWAAAFLHGMRAQGMRIWCNGKHIYYNHLSLHLPHTWYW